MIKPNDFKSMSSVELKIYIRQLEKENRVHPKSKDELDDMDYFEWEDYVIYLERERAFSEQGNTDDTQ